MNVKRSKPHDPLRHLLHPCRHRHPGLVDAGEREVSAVSAYHRAERTRELTPRHREVIQAMAEGLSNKAIADRYGLSLHTVKTHVCTIMDRLEQHDRLSIVLRAIELGLIAGPRGIDG